MASGNELSPRPRPKFTRTTRNTLSRVASEPVPHVPSTSRVALARELAALDSRLSARTYRSNRTVSTTSSHIAPLDPDEEPEGAATVTPEGPATQNQNQNPDPVIIMPETKKKIPESYEKNAPRFDDEKPEELTQFLDHVERMMALEETPDGEKNEFVVRYAMKGPADEWKAFKTFTKSYKKFKREILENYPSAIDSKQGSVRKLTKILKTFPDGDIELEDADDLMKLARQMNTEAAKLLASGLLTHREAIPMFTAKLHRRFTERIFDALNRRERPKPAAEAPAEGEDGAEDAAAEDEDSDVETDGPAKFTLEQVIEEAKWLAKQQDSNADFFQTPSVAANTSGGRSLSPARIKKEDVNHDATAMLEAIKLSVVNMMDRVEAQTNQRLSEMDTSTKKKLAELEQFYKSLPGKVPGAVDGQTLPPRPTVRFRPLTQANLCHYCAGDDGHWMMNCPHRQAHIANGWLKVMNGKDHYSNGSLLILSGTKSRKQLIEEFQAKGVVPAQTNVQSIYVQQGPGLYQMEPEERLAIATDDGEGYGYYDPAEYDPRDDEIRTLRVESNMMRQMVQHQQHQQRGVQPPLPPAPANQMDVNFLSSLLAATFAKVNPSTTPPAEQLAQTRANPSRTGTAQSNEGF